MSTPTIALNVVAFNESARIERCLSHVAPYVDEMIVVDQSSTDDTAAKAAALGAIVIPDENRGFGDPSRPLAEAASSSDWILILDADEEFTEAFLSGLRDLPSLGPEGYTLGRKNFFGGQFWSEDYHLRLFHRGWAIWPRPPKPHRQPRFAGMMAGTVTNAIRHDKTWAEQLADDESYERLGAGTGRFLALAREVGVSGDQLDAMTIVEAKALGFDCEAVRVAA